MARVSLTKEQLHELLRCQDSFRYWLQTYVQIQDPQKGVIPFELWPCHVQAIEALETKKLLVVLKARQIGMSWLFGAAYPIWLTQFRPNKLAMLFSIRDDEASELIRKGRFVWSHQPDWMRVALAKDNRFELEFAGMDSRILAFPSSPNAGSSYTANYVLSDEHAKQEYAEPQFAAIRPTIDSGGGQFVSLSTANGPGTLHAQLWAGAVSGINGFTPLFFGYNARPGRNEDWWNSTRVSYTEDWRFMAEYPRCIAGDVRVGTDIGLVRLDAPDWSTSAITSTTTGCVVGYYPKTEAPLLRITTKRGYSVRCTAEHPVATLAGWKDSDKLVPGDTIQLSRPRFASAEYVMRWRPFPAAETCLAITQEWGELLGYFAGDGSLYNHQLSLVVDAKDDDVVTYLEYLCKKLLGVNMARRVTGNMGGCTELRVRRAIFEELFTRLGVFDRTTGTCGKRRVCVPEVIWRSPRPVIAGFLRGLFEADGSANGSVGNISFCSKHQYFIRDVQLLLLGFGITSGIRVSNTTKTINGISRTFGGYQLHLRAAETDKFMSEIGFLSGRKNIVRSRKPGVGRTAIPITFSDEVLSVEPDGCGLVYDIGIEAQHAFDANGILVHNSPGEAIQQSQPRRFAEDILHLTASQLDPIDNGRLKDIISEDEDLAHLLLVKGRMNELGCRIYQLPRSGGSYVIGADVAEGNVYGDASAAVVLDRDTGEEVACLHGRWAIPDYAVHLDYLSNYYSAILGIERNNQGTACILAVQRLRQQRMKEHKKVKYDLYYEKPILDAQGKIARPGKPGWLTTARTKPMMLVELEQAMRQVDIRLATPMILQEMRTMLEDKDGKIGAAQGHHDDLVMATAIAYQMVTKSLRPQDRPRLPYAAGPHAKQRLAGDATNQSLTDPFGFERRMRVQEHEAKRFQRTPRVPLLKKLGQRTQAGVPAW